MKYLKKIRLKELIKLPKKFIATVFRVSTRLNVYASEYLSPKIVTSRLFRFLAQQELFDTQCFYVVLAVFFKRAHRAELLQRSFCRVFSDQTPITRALSCEETYAIVSHWYTREMHSKRV